MVSTASLWRKSRACGNSHSWPSKRTLATEMLALSKLNWNNTQFDGGEPITVRTARQVGDIPKRVPGDSDVPQRGFRYYM